MALQVSNDVDAEQERQQAVADLIAEHGSDWADGYKPGSFGCHELLDRTALAADLVEHYVLSHPACAQDEEWYELADRAVSALRELYQRVGAAHLGDGETTAARP